MRLKMQRDIAIAGVKDFPVFAGITSEEFDLIPVRHQFGRWSRTSSDGRPSAIAGWL